LTEPDVHPVGVITEGLDSGPTRHWAFDWFANNIIAKRVIPFNKALVPGSMCFFMLKQVL
jgi:hypothetical protein